MRVIILVLCARAAFAQIFFQTSYNGTVAFPPTFSPPAGAVNIGTVIDIHTATPGCDSYIRLSTTGTPTLSDPTGNSYTVVAPVTLQAAVMNCPVAMDSPVGTAAFSITVAATPTFSPTAGPIDSGTTVNFSTATTACLSFMHYSTTGAPTGSDPTGTSYVVTGPVTLRVAVIGCPAASDSAVGSASYTIRGPCDSGYAEDFGTDGALGACWSPVTVSGWTTSGRTIIASGGAGQVSANFAKAAEIMTGNYTADQSAEATIAALSTSGNTISLLVRADSAANGYGLLLASTGISIQRYSGGSAAQSIAASSACGSVVSVGSVYKLEVIGTALSAYCDSVLICSGTNSTIANGVPGLALNAGNSVAANVRVDNYVAH